MDELRDIASAGDPADSTAGKSRCPSTDIKPLICTEGSAAGNSQPARLESTASFHSSPEIARFVGKFRVIRLVGRGAFGEVYQAYDTELHRYVALKLPRAGALSQPDESTFLREAKNVSRLQHPGIVPVYDVGRTEQCCFIVSEFVEGITLAQEIRGKRLGVADAALIVAQLAEALDHAHRQGVIHRDLKPSNILLDRRRETGSSSIRLLNGLPDQQPLFPRIVDFGLGKRSMADASISLDAHVLGTPSYMSPEQAAGNSDRVDGRSDVYRLGVILYELLVGVVPFRGETLLSQVLMIHHRGSGDRPHGSSRPGSDLPEVPGEGATAAVSDGGRARRGFAALARGNAHSSPAREPLRTGCALLLAAESFDHVRGRACALDRRNGDQRLVVAYGPPAARRHTNSEFAGGESYASRWCAERHPRAAARRRQTFAATADAGKPDGSAAAAD